MGCLPLIWTIGWTCRLHHARLLPHSPFRYGWCFWFGQLILGRLIPTSELQRPVLRVRLKRLMPSHEWQWSLLWLEPRQHPNAQLRRQCLLRLLAQSSNLAPLINKQERWQSHHSLQYPLSKSLLSQAFFFHSFSYCFKRFFFVSTFCRNGYVSALAYA